MTPSRRKTQQARHALANAIEGPSAAHRSSTRQLIGADGKPYLQRVPYDANGTPLDVGDVVVRNEPSATWRRVVEAIGDDAVAGYVRLSDAIYWESPRNYVSFSRKEESK